MMFVGFLYFSGLSHGVSIEWGLREKFLTHYIEAVVPYTVNTIHGVLKGALSGWQCDIEQLFFINQTWSQWCIMRKIPLNHPYKTEIKVMDIIGLHNHVCSHNYTLIINRI